MTNLIVNGSFEDTTGLTETAYGFTGQPNGWTDANGSDFEIVRSGHVGQNASDGQFWLDSDQVGMNMDISQVVAGVQDGQSYDLSYDLSEWRDNGSNQLNVYWNNTLIHTYSGGSGDQNSFDSFEFVVVGEPGDNVIRFEEVGPVDSAGIVIDNVSLVASSVPCFLKGTLINTPSGQRLVEDLRPGDMVCTADNGFQSIQWVGAKVLSSQVLRVASHLLPIRVRKGAVGNEADLFVSPQHRLLMPTSSYDGSGREVLVSAKNLYKQFGGPFRVARGRREVSYHHILLDNHEIIWANGARVETMLLGEWTMRSLFHFDIRLNGLLKLQKKPMHPCRQIVKRLPISSFSVAA
ncbi:Hint domain-containing protein [Gymnodinialimonas hymeniacidonis]|uniref:Hint domain-containing protein n=1 Tax=Gymnodinialimonas hymeniacidonis TaxID=3126508 RepID=UPI0034C68530